MGGGYRIQDNKLGLTASLLASIILEKPLKYPNISDGQVKHWIILYSQ